MLVFDLKWLKQLMYPPEFRLPKPDFTEEQLALLEELIQLIQPRVAALSTADQDEKLQVARFLIQLATGIWRVRQRIEGLKRMPKDLKDALYALDSMWASMAAGGVSIVDHVGEPPLLKGGPKVLEVRLVPDLSREEVVETVLPTILLHGEVVQVGEVIVGRPAGDSAQDSEKMASGTETVKDTVPESEPVDASESSTVADSASETVPLPSEQEGIAGPVAPIAEPPVLSEEGTVNDRP